MGRGRAGTLALTAAMLAASFAAAVSLRVQFQVEGKVHSITLVELPLVVTGILFLADRAYASLREQHERLDRLHGFSRVVGGSEQSGAVVTAAILAQARDLLRADRAELTLFTGERARVRTVLGPATSWGPRSSSSVPGATRVWWSGCR
jgi:hypothetical protein